MLARAACALARLVGRASRSLLTSTPPDQTAYAVWAYCERFDGDSLPVFVVMREWCVGGRCGLSSEGTWEYWDDEPGHGIGLAGEMENCQHVATLIARGQLRRVGILPPEFVPGHMGYFGDKQERSETPAASA